MSQAELARRLHDRFHWSDDRSVINKVLKNRRTLSAVEALQISKVTGRPLPSSQGSANILDEENIIKNHQKRTIQPASFLHTLPIAGSVRVMGKVAANSWIDVDSMDFSYDDQKDIPSVGGYPPDWQFALIVEGKCLNKIANDGDILVCLDVIKAGSEARPGDLVIVERRRFDGQMVERTAKRLRRSAKGLELWPESKEPEHQDPIVLYEPDEDIDVRIMAVVLWIMRKP